VDPGKKVLIFSIEISEKIEFFQAQVFE